MHKIIDKVSFENIPINNVNKINIGNVIKSETGPILYPLPLNNVKRTKFRYDS